MVNHPVKYAEQRFLSLWSLWGPVVPSEYGIIGMILHGMRFPFFILAICAFLFRNKMEYDKSLILMMSFPVISLTLIHFFFFSDQRHQTVAEPFVVILGILFLSHLFKSRFLKN